MKPKRILIKTKIFIGETRPAYDSAPFAEISLTNEEYHTLTRIVARYVGKILDRRKAEAQQ